MGSSISSARLDGRGGGRPRDELGGFDESGARTVAGGFDEGGLDEGRGRKRPSGRVNETGVVRRGGGGLWSATDGVQVRMECAERRLPMFLRLLLGRRDGKLLARRNAGGDGRGELDAARCQDLDAAGDGHRERTRVESSPLVFGHVAQPSGRRMR